MNSGESVKFISDDEPMANGTFDFYHDEGFNVVINKKRITSDLGYKGDFLFDHTPYEPLLYPPNAVLPIKNYFVKGEKKLLKSLSYLEYRQMRRIATFIKNFFINKRSNNKILCFSDIKLLEYTVGINFSKILSYFFRYEPHILNKIQFGWYTMYYRRVRLGKGIDMSYLELAYSSRTKHILEITRDISIRRCKNCIYKTFFTEFTSKNVFKNCSCLKQGHCCMVEKNE